MHNLLSPGQLRSGQRCVTDAVSRTHSLAGGGWMTGQPGVLQAQLGKYRPVSSISTWRLSSLPRHGLWLGHLHTPPPSRDVSEGHGSRDKQRERRTRTHAKPDEAATLARERARERTQDTHAWPGTAEGKQPTYYLASDGQNQTWTHKAGRVTCPAIRRKTAAK